MKTTTKPCDKCNGSGRIGTLAHVANGQCFRCHGTGRVVLTQAERLAALDRELAEAAGYDPFSGLTVDEWYAAERQADLDLEVPTLDEIELELV